MRHQDLTLNHRLESWVYANDAARTGAIGFVSGDIGRIAYQTDTGQYWRLIATTPTWQLLPAIPTGGTVGQSLIKNTAANYDGVWKTPLAVHFAPGNPSGGAFATQVMMGLGASPKNVVFTLSAPTTGRVLLVANGFIANGTAGALSMVDLRYGSGTPPVNGTAATGIVLTYTVAAHAPTAGGNTPFSQQSVVTGLVAGTTYWVDLGLVAPTGSGSVGNLGVDVIEL